MTAFWNIRTKRREAAMAADQQQVNALRSELRIQLARGERAAVGAARQVERQLGQNATAIADVVAAQGRVEHGDWSAERWSSWTPDTTVAVSELRVGVLRETSTDLIVGAPLVVPVHGESGPIVIVSRDAEQAAAAGELVRSLVVRIAACFARQARFALLDPAHHGTAFPMSRKLERVLLGFEDPRLALNELSADVLRIETTILDRHHPTFERVPAALRLAESRQFLVAASFPTGYSESAASAVATLAVRGVRAGVHTILHLDLGASPESEALLDALRDQGATVLDLAGTAVDIGGIDGTVVFDEAPSGAVEEIVFQRIAATPRRDLPIPYDTVNDAMHSTESWWSDTADDLLAAPVGRAMADQVYDLWFGAEPQLARSCRHGIVIGAAAAGRQALYDGLLAGLATQYSPADVRVILVEGMHHRTFDRWRRLPHIQLIGLAASPDQARGVLVELRYEVERRLTELHRQGVEHFAAYRALSQAAPMARLLAVFDDYEQLFVDDLDDLALGDLRVLLEQGESAGVHVLLGGSRFDQAGPLHRAGLFGQLDLRMALQLAPDDALGRDEFGVRGVRLVSRVCDRPMRAVINTLGGHDDANVAVQLAVLEPHRRDELVERLIDRARLDEVRTPAASVLDGAEQPQLADNPLLARLAADETLRSAEGLASLARTAPGQGGLGIDDWITEEHPRLLFIGQEDHLRGHAHLVLRRRPTENVLVVMPDRNVRAGSLAGALVSTAMADDRLELWLVDRGPVGTPSGDVLEQTVRRLARLDVPCRFTRSGEEAAHFIRAVGEEIARRRSLDEGELERQPTVLLVLTDPERIPALTRVPTAHGVTDSPLGLDLRYVLMHGPGLGVHVVIASGAPAALRTVLSDSVVQQDFRHRIVTRMAEEDSFSLVRSSRAATLTSADSGRPAAALLFDGHTQSAVTFAPYSSGIVESGRHGPMAAQIAVLLDQLAEQMP